jgi:hypothetical protein
MEEQQASIAAKKHPGVYIHMDHEPSVTDGLIALVHAVLGHSPISWDGEMQAMTEKLARHAHVPEHRYREPK